MDVSAVDRRLDNLPADVTSFVGRRREIADIKTRLSGSRLVTLTGMGGVGKTRLGLRVAWEVRRGFADGVWLVELAGLRDPGLVAHSLATSLGLREGSAGLSPAWLSDLLATRQVLIVLDNCEHLLDPCAVLANELLRACRGVRILATSRQALGIDGEYVVGVLPFSVPEHGQRTSTKELARYEAVNLFVERATAVRDGFQIDPANQAAVAAICRRLDGIPLAVELAASRLRGLSVDELMVRLDDRYALLTGGSRAALPRQQTLRSLIDWSFDLCSGAERLLWARLSVFAGGFDLAAAERVCSDHGLGSDAVWDLVTRLVDKSIVVATEGVLGARYELSETLREYGRDRLLESGDTDRVRARHRDWCRELVTQAEADWFGANQATILSRLRREHANLRVALDFCLSKPVETEIGLAMASALRFYWNLSGRVKEGRHWLAQFLAASDKRGPAQLKAMCVSGYLATIDSDFTAASAVLDEADSLAARLRDWPGATLVTQIEGILALFQNDPERAESLFEDALDTHRRLGDEPAAIYDQVQVALTAALLGESDRASGLLDDCLSVTRSHGEHWLTAMSLWALGIERCKQGDYQQAESLQLESLRLRFAMDDRWSIGLNVQVLGWIAAASGDARRAARLLGASEAVAHSVGLSPAALGHLNAIQQSYEGIGRRDLTDAGFDEAYAEGRQLTFDDAVGLALGTASRPPAPGAGMKPLRARDLLTKRESEVAELISRGMSNKEIAATLVISKRTAETHVEHILTKLGLSSRTQVAVRMSLDRDDQSG
jgi:predicted ATPase/DNA-binding CsgD family transcriptional regulator